MNKPSILIIDDDPDNFDVIETFLSEQDYQLHYFNNGYDAIAGLDIVKPDLILLDVMMPKLDGFTVCQNIKAMPKWSHVPIIMVTALSSKFDLAHCLEAGADDFIGKPVNGLELRSRINSMLRIKQQYDQIQALSHLQENTINFLETTLKELRGNLALTLSHELNTPLNGILGVISLLREDLEEMDSASILDMLNWAYESACRLDNLTKKFLIYLELELVNSQHKNKESPQTTFLAGNVSQKIIYYAEQVNRSNDLSFELVDSHVAISERYLSIILDELIDNALKFSKPGTLIQIGSRVIENNLFSLWFRDFGHGMTNEQITKIGAFMQFDKKLHQQPGTGMGLKIVQKIIELVGGTFTITSIYHQETRVEISLPIIL